jgi:hypothetical protein
MGVGRGTTSLLAHSQKRLKTYIVTNQTQRGLTILLSSSNYTYDKCFSLSIRRKNGLALYFPILLCLKYPSTLNAKSYDLCYSHENNTPAGKQTEAISLIQNAIDTRVNTEANRFSQLFLPGCSPVTASDSPGYVCSESCSRAASLGGASKFMHVQFI